MTRRRILRAVGLAVLLLLAWLGSGYIGAQRACAHDPRFACSPRDTARAIHIADPTKSWAFYGRLAPGQHDRYVFTLKHTVTVPWNLLIEQKDVANSARPVAILTNDSGAVVARATLKGAQSFFEPFSRIHYLSSPPVNLHLAAGNYHIEVVMNGPGSMQRYVMAIGEKERFGLWEIPYVLGAIHRIRTRGW
ncbi:MAG: hypothetical protein HKL91_08490 [Candidatus Eremiobacteraeota bacterium]|uniref:Uncharacterized protein n=1 Tax=mine drainage metagenome TaxID=410659 RepID=E6PIJ7_9ZZZZ|nr:hypothetical protein [Candidatus Eremiobacteraeota bacterium]